MAQYVHSFISFIRPNTWIHPTDRISKQKGYLIKAGANHTNEDHSQGPKMMSARSKSAIKAQDISNLLSRIEENVLWHHSRRLTTNGFKFHDVSILQVIEKCYLFKEKLPLLLIQDLEHFLDYNCCRCGISWQSVLGRINIAISSFPNSLLACVAGVRRGRKEERQAHEAREDRTREDRGKTSAWSARRSDAGGSSSLSTACHVG